MNSSKCIIVGAPDKETEFPAMLSEQPVCFPWYGCLRALSCYPGGCTYSQAGWKCDRCGYCRECYYDRGVPIHLFGRRGCVHADLGCEDAKAVCAEWQWSRSPGYDA